MEIGKEKEIGKKSEKKSETEEGIERKTEVAILEDSKVMQYRSLIQNSIDQNLWTKERRQQKEAKKVSLI